MCWVFVSLQGLSLVVASRGHSSSQCAGLSLSRPLLLQSTGSRRTHSNCGSRAQLFRGMWDLPRPGLEPMSPALAGRLSTTAPPGKPSTEFFNVDFYPATLLNSFITSNNFFMYRIFRVFFVLDYVICKQR